MRSTYFPDHRWLAVQQHGKVTVHDTGRHQIGGFGQQQADSQSLTFTRQHGTVDLKDLPQV